MSQEKRNNGRLRTWLQGARWRKILFIAVSILLTLALLLVLAGCFLLFCPWGLFSENNPFNLMDNPVPAKEMRLQHNGVEYRVDEDVVNILILGVDQVDENDPGWVESLSRAGRADTLVLCSYNTRTGEVVLLPLSRHLVARQGLPSLNGQSVPWYFDDHLCLAYSYGNDARQSAQLTKASVSWLFLGLPIHRYVSVQIEAVRPITDYLGGVQVFTLPDFAEVAGVEEGTGILLDGEMAELFVRGRSLTGMTGRDLDRMVRQRVFMFSLLDTVKARVKENPLFALGLYAQAKPYISTDLSLREMGNLARGLLLQDGEIALEVMSGDEDNQVYVPGPGWIEWFMATYCMRPVVE